MKIIFHEKYFDVYSGDPASAKGRLDGPYQLLEEEFEFARPTAASEADLQLVHTADHIERVRRDADLFEIASLAVGGAVLASEIATRGDAGFGLIRPPGHHASPNSCWGFCFFNNIAIAVKKLLASGSVDKALIVDFDLHFGDGTHCSGTAL
jgi:acetoin utilization deacetylase AcuC-like enzyme